MRLHNITCCSALVLTALSCAPVCAQDTPSQVFAQKAVNPPTHSEVIEEITPQALAQLAEERRKYEQQLAAAPVPIPRPPAAAEAPAVQPPPAAAATLTYSAQTAGSQHTLIGSGGSGQLALTAKQQRRADYITASVPPSARFPYTTADKARLAVKDVYDPFNLVGEAGQALFNQAQGDTYKFGGGAEGYGKRMGAIVATDATGELFGTFLFPSLLHTDPRYFRMGHGNVGKRAVYALTRILIVRKDSGGNTFNAANWLAGTATTSISNLYYPDRKQGIGPTMEKTAINIGFDSLNNLFREFWPEIAHGLHIPAFVIRRTADASFPDQQPPPPAPEPAPKP